MGWLGDSSHRGQGCQAWTAVGLPPRYPLKRIPGGLIELSMVLRLGGRSTTFRLVARQKYVLNYNAECMQLLTKQTTATYSTLSNVQYWRWQDGSERLRAQWMSASREYDAVIILFTTIKTTNKITKQNCNYIRVFKWKTIMCSWNCPIFIKKKQ